MFPMPFKICFQLFLILSNSLFNLANILKLLRLCKKLSYILFINVICYQKNRFIINSYDQSILLTSAFNGAIKWRTKVCLSKKRALTAKLRQLCLNLSSASLFKASFKSVSHSALHG